MTRSAVWILMAMVGATAGTAHAATGPTGVRSEEVAYSDPTPDPTGLAVGADGHCSGLLPREAPYKFTAPRRGTLKVTLGGFEGVWGLHLQDEKGTVQAETDSTSGDPALSVKVRKAGAVVQVAPCNIAGTPTATITLVFTPA